MAMAGHHIAWQSYVGNDPRVLVMDSNDLCVKQKHARDIDNNHRPQVDTMPPVRDITTFKECLGGSKGRPTYYPPVSNTEGWEIPALNAGFNGKII